MTIARLSLLALSLLAGAHTVLAKAPAGPVPATPVGSPGDWLTPSDYPPLALRFEMTGITGFRLAVDMAGKAVGCEIVVSSGFDVLDAATCERLMAHAQFTPARDRSGKPTAGTYTNRVRWMVPEGGGPPVSERYASMLLSIDQAGKVKSCRVVLHVPTDGRAQAENPCEQALEFLPPDMGLDFRGGSKDPLAVVEMRLADVFTPDLKAQVLAATPGYEQRGLSIHRFTVSNIGKLGQCSYEEHRGSRGLATDFCVQWAHGNFDPPFSAFDNSGVATGWHIARVLLKTGQ